MRLKYQLTVKPHLTETNPVQEEPVCTETPVTEPIDTVPIAEYRPVESLESLFIGDSRTVALADYATIEDANFFATFGMTVYNIWDARVSIPQIGKVTLNELRNDKQYDMIYIMLGVNELGYAFDKTVCRYEALVESVQTLQPDAVVILMANIHVTAQRSESDPYINNPAIDRFNEATSRLADSRTVFYLAATSLFDDADGNLAAEKSADNAHLKAKHKLQYQRAMINKKLTNTGTIKCKLYLRSPYSFVERGVAPNGKGIRRRIFKQNR